jgi:flagellar motor switch protein FliG
MAEGNGAMEGLDGAERAAIFLLTLGEQSAAAVLKHMGPKEVQQVGMAMANIKNVPKAVVGRVLEDFVSTVQEQTSLGISSED